MKDYFSAVSREYAQYRPKYPPELFNFLDTQIRHFNTAWDCATGNGQIALPLSERFKKVYGTDISESQLKIAPSKKNIYYSIQPAEKTDFAPNSFDLTTVGQAVHWFNFNKFYEEVFRTLNKDGLIAIMGYGLMYTNKEVQEIIDNLYFNTLGPYWDPERRYIEEKYLTIPFPFNEISVPHFEYKNEWKFEILIGYLKTWSAVNHFQKKNGFNPVDEIIPELLNKFGKEGTVRFPILLRVGRKI